MGLFDSILKQGAKRLISEVTNAAIDTVTDEIKKNFADGGSNNTTTSTATTVKKELSLEERLGYKVPEGYEDVAEETVDVKLRAVFQREFPQYEIREGVSPTTIGGTGNFMPYTFGVYENGQPKLFIMEVYNNTCRERLYRWSKEEAEKAGVPMINFVGLFENKIDYIIDRLHQYL